MLFPTDIYYSWMGLVRGWTRTILSGLEGCSIWRQATCIRASWTSVSLRQWVGWRDNKESSWVMRLWSEVENLYYQRQWICKHVRFRHEHRGLVVYIAVSLFRHPYWNLEPKFKSWNISSKWSLCSGIEIGRRPRRLLDEHEILAFGKLFRSMNTKDES